MKLSNEWVHQPDVDQAADAILAEGMVTLATITACQVAKRLDRSANPSMYRKFRDWRARREAEAEPVTIDVPPEVEAGIRAIFARLSDDGVAACLGAVRVVGGSLDRFAMLRLGDADRRVDRAEAETAEVVAIGEKIEKELGAATIRIAELEQALADAQRREDRLAAHLELREADLAAALSARNSVEPAMAGTTPDVQRDDVGKTVAADPGGGYDEREGAGDDGDVATDGKPVVDGQEAGTAVHLADATPASVNQLPLTFAGNQVDNAECNDAS